MTCSRCAGFCVLESERTEDCLELDQWRCVNCGYRTETVMEANRMGQVQAA